MCALQGGDLSEGEAQRDRAATQEQAADPLYAKFQKYDISNHGYLSQYAVGEMMKDMGARRYSTQSLHDRMLLS